MSRAVDQLDELPDVDWLDWSMCRDGQGASVRTDEYAMTSAAVPPVDPMLSSDDLKLADPPIERIVPHGGQKLGRRAHRGMILSMRSHRNSAGQLPRICGENRAPKCGVAVPTDLGANASIV